MMKFLGVVAIAISMIAAPAPAVEKSCQGIEPNILETKVAESSWPDGPGYAGASCTFEWVDISMTGTEIQLEDDSSDGPFDLGFEFSLYDHSADRVWISSNGYLDFTGGSSDAYNQCPMLDQDRRPNIVAPMWDDLDPGASGDPIFYQAFESCPLGSGRCFIAQWQDICLYPGGAECDKAGTFEAIVYEDGRIVLQILDAGTKEGESSTTGIAGSDLIGDHQLVFACNEEGSLSADLCLQMDPVFGLYRYVVGGVAHVEGSQGTAWRSSLSAASTSTKDTDLEFTFHENNGQTSADSVLAAGEIKEWDDVTESLFGLGRDGAGSVTVLTDAELILTVRTYNQTADGTFGQYLPGLRQDTGMEGWKTGRLPHLKSNSDFRTNIGFINLTDSQCDLDYQLFDHLGSPLGGWERVTIGPFGWKQVNRVFGGLGAQSIAYADVHPPADCRAWAYASVVDENTGDPTTIPLNWED